MSEQADPKHGDERNRRTETQTRYENFILPNGKTHRIAAGGLTQTVSERYCEVCGEWRTAKGIMGALVCPVCVSPWNKKFWETRP